MIDVAKIYYIYGLTDPLSGIIRYIGKSSNPKSRFREHFQIRENPKTHKEKWINSLIRLGLKPELIIIETTTKDQASIAEIFWIAEYRSRGFNLTNTTDGGEGVLGNKFWLGRNHSIESKLQMSKSQKGNKNSLGIKHSIEVRKRMGQSQIGNKNSKGVIRTEENKRKVSEGLKRYYAGK